MISVALCTHNGERFLEEQLRSILSQTLQPDEIVLSDDASTDGTVALAERILAEHPSVRLRVLRNGSPLGVTKNFEQAVSTTTGELVALSDQDDVWEPERLQRYAAEFAARPTLLLLHGEAELVDAEGALMGVRLFDALDTNPWELDRIRSGRAFDALVRRNLALGASVVFRRTLLEHALPFPVSWVHDEWLAIIAAAIGAAWLFALGTVMVVCCLAVAFWEQRVLVFGLAAALFLGVGLLVFASLRSQMAQPSKIFRGSLAELEADMAQLRRRKDVQ